MSSSTKINYSLIYLNSISNCMECPHLCLMGFSCPMIYWLLTINSITQSFKFLSVKDLGMSTKFRHSGLSWDMRSNHLDQLIFNWLFYPFSTTKLILLYLLKQLRLIFILCLLFSIVFYYALFMLSIWLPWTYDQKVGDNHSISHIWLYIK
jgi:hypothetical protein